jgi:hydroxymethylpyrimidine pyrophosphatase-like HAD family hydrolase
LKRTAYIFDLDDTLVRTNAKIHVFCRRTEKLLHSLSPSDYNIFDKEDHHILNFEEFDDLEILLEGTMIQENLDKLMEAHRLGFPIGIITARSHYASVAFFLKAKRIPVELDMLYVVNDPIKNFTGDVPSRKKQAFEDLVRKGFNSFVYYDDDEKNIKMAKDFGKETKVKMQAIKIEYDKDTETRSKDRNF